MFSRRRVLFLSGTLLLVGLLFGLARPDYHRAYPYVDFSFFSTWRQYLAFRKNLWRSLVYDLAVGVKVVRLGDGISFDQVSPYSSEAVKLRKLLNLEEIARKASSPYELGRRLKEWTHLKIVANLRRSRTPPEDPKNAIRILGLIDEGFQIACGNASSLFVQAAAALGYPAREVWGGSHIAVEMWLPDLRKWVYFDPTHNVHYEIDGAPVNFLEMEKRFFPDGRARDGYSGWASAVGRSRLAGLLPVERIRWRYQRNGVRMIGTPHPNVANFIIHSTYGDLTPKHFQSFSVTLGNNFLWSYPDWHVRNFRNPWNHLIWGKSPKPPPLVFQVSSKLEDFYWQPRSKELERYRAQANQRTSP